MNPKRRSAIRLWPIIWIAKETGLISEVDEIIFDKTSTDIGIMQKYQPAPESVNLEVTESASINTRRTLLESMQRLIDYGVSFSLDDFGNGQSNLNYIVDMPVQIVKFDRNMTRAFPDFIKKENAF